MINEHVENGKNLTKTHNYASVQYCLFVMQKHIIIVKVNFGDIYRSIYIRSGDRMGGGGIEKRKKRGKLKNGICW